MHQGSPRSDERDGTAISRGVHVLDSKPRSCENLHLHRSVARLKRAEHLHHLAVDFDGDQPLSISIECGDCGRLVHDGALERRSRCRLESKKKVPQRSDDESLEENSGCESNGEQNRLAQQIPEYETGRTESERDAEQQAWRHQREERIRVRSARVVSMCAMCVVTMGIY